MTDIHEAGIRHIEEDYKELQAENDNLKLEVKRLKESEERLRECNDKLAQQAEELQEQIAKDKRIMARQGERLPFDHTICECRFEKKFSKDPAWAGWSDYFCMHKDNFDRECDAMDYVRMYPLVDVTCPRVVSWLKEREE